jgi:hypothetical protein
MRTRILPIVIAIAGAALLAGCSSAGSTQAQDAGVAVGQEAPALGAPVPDSVTPDKAAAGGAVSTTVTTDRQIIKNAYVAMRVEDVTKSAFDIHGLIKKRNGLISSEDTQASGDSTSSMITAQIPAADLDAFIADVTQLGTVDSVSVTAQDVTGTVVDLDARIKALQTSVDRMTQLLAQAQKIDDMLAIETQLAARQAELDSLNSQRKTLGEQVALSTVTIALSPTTTVTSVDAPGFLSGLESGWAAFISVLTIGFTAAGFLLPFALVALLVLIPVTIVLVRQSRRRRRAAAASSAQPHADDQAASPTTT